MRPVRVGDTDLVDLVCIIEDFRGDKLACALGLPHQESGRWLQPLLVSFAVPPTVSASMRRSEACRQPPVLASRHLLNLPAADHGFDHSHCQWAGAFGAQLVQVCWRGVKATPRF